MSCPCSSGTCTSCVCSRHDRGCTSSCHQGDLNPQCLNLRLQSGLDIKSMPLHQVKTELIRRNIYNLDDTGPQLKALLLRTLASEEKRISGSGSSGSKKKSISGLDEMDSDDSSSSSSDSSKVLDPIEIARRILESPAGDNCAILNVLSSFPSSLHPFQLKSICDTTPTTEMKKIFRFIATQIHPDKLQNKFQKATQAFQLLVSAYDHLCQGEILSGDSRRSSSSSSSSTSSSLTLTRSNTNCFVTPVYCPRCAVEWNQKADGLEPIAYTIFMLGLQSFCCSTCLLSFGCISALHRCPFCRSKSSCYDYSPHDFHRQLSCSVKNCGKKFGFLQNKISDKRMRELKEQLKAEQEKRHRENANKDSRTERAKKRKQKEEEEEEERETKRNKKKQRPDSPPASSSKSSKSSSSSSSSTSSSSSVPSSSTHFTTAETTFLLGLSDCCPRCGLHPSSSSSDESSLRAHLDECTDVTIHAAYKKQMKEMKDKEQKKEAVKKKEEDSQSGQVWQLLGAKRETSWMLSEGAIEQQLRLTGDNKIDGSKKQKLKQLQDKIIKQKPEESLRITGEKHSTESIAAQVAKSNRSAIAIRYHQNSSSSSAAADSSSSSSTPIRPTTASLPSNLHLTSLSQLHSIFTAHQMDYNEEESKDVLIERLEAARDGREVEIENENEEKEQEKEKEKEKEKDKPKEDTKTKKQKTKTKTETETTAAATTSSTSSSSSPSSSSLTPLSTLISSLRSILSCSDLASLSLNHVLTGLIQQYSMSHEEVRDRKKEIKQIMMKLIAEKKGE